MKKIITLLITIFTVVTLLCPACLAEENEALEIFSAKELMSIEASPSARYKICADIDLSGVDWIPIPFHGVLDGQGHTLYNLTVNAPGAETCTTYDGNNKPYDTSFAALFSDASGAVISNTKLMGVNISVSPQKNCFAAGFAGFADETVIENCSVSGKLWLNNYSEMAGVAGIAGFGQCEISGCSTDVELGFVDENTDTKCEQFMGGAMACGVCTVSDCEIKLKGWISCRGYVHSGGFLGLINHCEKSDYLSSVNGGSLSGEINFFEDNTDRRAYCMPVAGEILMPTRYDDYESGFQAKEVFTYDTVLSPESCAEPDYVNSAVKSDCTSWGYTLHSCRGCGYSWKDSYTPPAHSPGEPEVIREAAYGSDGLTQTHCTLCGALIEEQISPALKSVENITLNSDLLSLNYKEQGEIKASIFPEDATDTALLWSSSDEAVATVDKAGIISATGRGTATIQCSSADGFAQAQCQVSVSYSFGQWLIVILLFGWLWY